MCGERRADGSEFIKGCATACLLAERSLLLLELHGAHAADGLLAFDALFLTCLQDLLVFDAEFAALDIESVQRGDNSIRVRCLTEVGKRESSELSGLIKMIVEGVRSRDLKRSLLWICA